MNQILNITSLVKSFSTLEISTNSILEIVKRYARIEHNLDDIQLQMLIKAAELYLENAGVVKSSSELYQLAVSMLTIQYYEERSQQIVSRNVTKLSFGLESIILQLKEG